MIKKSKLTVAAALATAMLTSAAFAQSAPEGVKETVFQPNSPVVTGGGSLGYNEAQDNGDR